MGWILSWVVCFCEWKNFCPVSKRVLDNYIAFLTFDEWHPALRSFISMNTVGLGTAVFSSLISLPIMQREGTWIAWSSSWRSRAWKCGRDTCASRYPMGRECWLTGGRDLAAQGAARTQQKRSVTTVPMKRTLKRDMSAQPHVTPGHSPEAGMKMKCSSKRDIIPEGIKWKKPKKLFGEIADSIHPSMNALWTCLAPSMVHWDDVPADFPPSQPTSSTVRPTSQGFPSLASSGRHCLY